MSYLLHDFMITKEQRFGCWKTPLLLRMIVSDEYILSVEPYSEILFLFYPITLEGRRATTDVFATIPFHLVLFSAALVELAKSIPVHSLI